MAHHRVLRNPIFTIILKKVFVPGKELGVADSQRQAAVVCSDMVMYSVVENSLQYLVALLS